MKLDQLSYFLAAARYEHIGKAAKSLAISPSAVSHSIAALEEELSRPLFFREGKRIALTPQGRMLASGAADILERLGALKADVSLQAHRPQGRFRLGATHSLAADCLAPAWTSLYRAYPHLTGEIKSLSSSQVVTLTAAGELDLGLCFNPQAHAKLAMRVVYRGTMVTCVRADHPVLAMPQAHRLEALRGYPAAGPRLLPGVTFRDDCLMADVERSRGDLDFAYDDYDVARYFVARTDAWTILPCWVHKRRGSHLQIIHSDQGDAFEVVVVWPKSRVPPAGIEELIERIETELRA